MSENITVECTMSRNGRVWIKRVKLDEDWMRIEQGRQWHDERGRHVLVMLPGGQLRELLLSAKSLRWQVEPRRHNPQIL